MDNGLLVSWEWWRGERFLNDIEIVDADKFMLWLDKVRVDGRSLRDWLVDELEKDAPDEPPGPEYDKIGDYTGAV